MNAKIRIEPDWNVKTDISLRGLIGCFIRIEPDWNVKLSHGLNQSEGCAY